MVEKPENFIEAFIKAGANTVTIHSENNPMVVESLLKIRNAGCQAGLAVNPETPPENIIPYLEYVNLVLIMTVNPGFSGQGFKPETLEKVKTVSGLMKNYPNISYLQVDGGINSRTIPLVSGAGANCFVAATAIFNNPVGIMQSIKDLRKAIA
jgi:ribulose-phosphate 3-epimerase